jgi:2'-5' RNA ligase
MTDAIRCFLAVKIPAETALRRVLRELSEMGRALKAVEPENLHVTLKFLGPTNPELLPEILKVAESAASSQTRGQLNVAGLGAFPHLQRPNVVWAGLEGPAAKTLSALAGQLEESLAAIGFAREERKFIPHLTLARVKAKPPETLRQLVERHAKTAFGTATVEEIELIRSEPGPGGSIYSVLERCALPSPQV